MIPGSYYAGDARLMDAETKTTRGGPGDVYPLVPGTADPDIDFATRLLEAGGIPWVMTKTNGHWTLYRSWRGLKFRDQYPERRSVEEE